MKPLSKKEAARRLRSAAGRSAPDIWQEIENRLDYQPYGFEQPARKQRSMRLPALAAAAAALALTVGILLSQPWNHGRVPPVTSDPAGSVHSQARVLKEGTDYRTKTAGQAGSEGSRVLDSLEAAEAYTAELSVEAESLGNNDLAALKIVSGYDAAFFEEHVVLVIVRRESSPNMVHRVTSVTVEKGELVAAVEQSAVAQAGDAVLTPFGLFVELKREAVKGCGAYYVEENGTRERANPVKKLGEVPFRSRATLVDCPDDGKWGPDVQLLYSIEDLEEYLASLGPADLSGRRGMLSAADILNSVLETGFPDHPLAVIRIRESGAQIRHRVRQVRNGDGLTITLQRLTQPEAEAGGFCWMIFVELLEDGGQWTGCKLDIEDHEVNAPAYNIATAPVVCLDDTLFTTEYGLSHTRVEGISSYEDWIYYLDTMGQALDFSYQVMPLPTGNELHTRYDQAFFQDNQLIAVTMRGNWRAAYCGVSVLYDQEQGTWLLSTGESLPYDYAEDPVGVFPWRQIYIELPRDAGIVSTELHMTDQLYSYAWPEPNSTMTSVNGVLIRDFDGDGMPEIFRVDMEQNRPILKVNGQTVAGLSTDIEWLFMPELRDVDLDLDGKPELLISLPTGGSGGDTFLAAARKTADGWRVFPLPSLNGVSGFGVSVTALDATHLAVFCPATGFQQTVELPEPFYGYSKEHTGPESFSIDGTLDIFELTGDRRLHTTQMIWTEVHANAVAWLNTTFAFGPDGWTVVEQSVTPETSAQDEVSTPSIPTQGVTNP